MRAINKPSIFMIWALIVLCLAGCGSVVRPIDLTPVPGPTPTPVPVLEYEGDLFSVESVLQDDEGRLFLTLKPNVDNIELIAEPRVVIGDYSQPFDPKPQRNGTLVAAFDTIPVPLHNAVLEFPAVSIPGGSRVSDRIAIPSRGGGIR